MIISVRYRWNVFSNLVWWIKSPSLSHAHTLHLSLKQNKMQRRNPHTPTSDLLTWSEQPPPDSSASGHRSRQVTTSIYCLCFIFYSSIGLVGSIESRVKIYNEFVCLFLNRLSIPSLLIKSVRFSAEASSPMKKHRV